MPSQTASSGAPPPPPTRSRAATGTTTGGRGSTRPARRAPSRAATPATTATATPRTSACSPTSGSARYRFSLEWSRIEPEDGEFSRVALDHYRRMCAACREHGLEPVVTFHHFTTPRWVAARGGWAEPDDRRPLRPLLRARRGHLGDVDRAAPARSTSRTWSPPSATSSASSRPASATRDRRRRVNDVFVDAHRKAVDGDQARAGRRSGRADAGHVRLPGRRRRRGRAATRTAHGMGGRLPRGRHAATTSSACRPTRATASGPTAMLGPEPGVPR